MLREENIALGVVYIFLRFIYILLPVVSVCQYQCNLLVGKTCLRNAELSVDRADKLYTLIVACLAETVDAEGVENIQPVDIDIGPTALLSSDVGRAKIDVRQRNKRPPTAAYLKQRQPAAEVVIDDASSSPDADITSQTAAAEPTKPVRCNVSSSTCSQSSFVRSG